ncbi:MAG: DUF4397 domain-containing protein [Betaproteobacteria bacterium]|nr:MAG: DUF4397 domain-containing protein [Betaproteobacteria bacterium]
MRMHRVLLGAFWLSLVAIAMTACNSGKGVTDPAVQFAMLRIVNLIPDASGPLNVTIDGHNFVSGLNFEGVTQYQQIDSGTRAIQVSVAGGASNIITTSLSFTGITNYTLIIYGPVAAATNAVISDATIDPGAGNFNLRAINAATGVAAVDVYVTAPGANLDAAAPNIAGVSLSAASAFVTLPAGNVEIRITPASTKEVIYDSAARSLAEHSNVEALIYTRTSGRLVGVTLLNIDSTGTSSTSPNLLAQFKVINGSSVPSPLNVFVNQNLLLSNIPFAGASSYQRTFAGSPTLSIEATATPGAALLTLMPTFGPGTDSSILLTGPAGALQALVLSDNNLPPVSNRARVRLVNGSTDVSALDVYVNFSKLVSSLAMNAAMSGLEFVADPVAGTTYEFDFNVAGTSQSSLKMPGVALFGGKTYTIYVVGPQAALSGVFTGDN